MEDKVVECKSAPEAKELLEELTMYLSVTKDQQTARVEQVHHLSCITNTDFRLYNP